jgi:hypothetical protein
LPRFTPSGSVGVMKDLANPAFIKLKGFLLLFIGVFSGALLLIEHPDLKTALLLAVCVWSFCRAYYFAFYVIENYVDPSFRFAGLWAFLRYLVRRRSR